MTSLLSDSGVIISWIVVWSLLLVALILVLRAKNQVVSALQVAREKSLRQLFSERSGVDDPIGLESWIHGATLDDSGDRLIVRNATPDKLKSLVENAFSVRARQGLGNSLTGVALVITFTLIAIVLFGDVPEAIKDANLAKSKISLGNAVGRMGLKFVLSASGVFATLLFRVAASSARRQVVRATDTFLEWCADQWEDAESARFKREAESLAVLRRIDAQVQAGIGRISDDIGHLRSIEVSVKDLGTEVSAGLGRMMQETLADQMKGLLEDMKVSAERIQEDVQSFADQALRRTAGQIVEELRSVNATLQSQAGSQVEQLLSKLQSAVSGGFSAESRNVTEQLGRFADVIPRLASQMDGVVGRMEGVLSQLGQQQARSEQTLAEMAATSRAQADQFGAAFAQSGSDALNRVFSETSTGIDELVGALRSVVQHSHQSSDSVRKNMSEASQAVAAALIETRQTADAIKDEMRAVEVGLARAAQTGQTLQSVTDSLSRTITTMQTTVGRLGELSHSVAGMLAGHNEVQRTQAQLLDQMQTVWPTLLEAVATRVHESTKSLNESWADAASKLERATGRQVGALASAVEELTSTVGNLQTVVSKPREAAGGR